MSWVLFWTNGTPTPLPGLLVNWTTSVADSDEEVATLVAQSMNARIDFNVNPSPSTALKYAQSYWYYLDDNVNGANSLNTYPLMFFINSDRWTYMLYSDVTKCWFTAWYEDEDTIFHDLDTFWSFGANWVFEFRSDGASFIFDANFAEPLITRSSTDTFLSSK